MEDFITGALCLNFDQTGPPDGRNPPAALQRLGKAARNHQLYPAGQLRRLSLHAGADPVQNQPHKGVLVEAARKALSSSRTSPRGSSSSTTPMSRPWVT